MMNMLVVLYVTVRFSAELGASEGGEKKEEICSKPNCHELLIILC